jgi:diaminopimelate decarboxylase
MKYIDSGALVIFDSISQLQWIQNIGYPIQIGIRLNLDYIKKDDSLYNCKISRFGIDAGESSIFDLIGRNKNIRITCLHCHFSGNSRDPNVYAEIAKELCRIIKEKGLSCVQMIDIGGGYKIAPQFWNFNDYVNTVTAALVEQSMENLTVIYEPGNSLVRTSCSYITKIIDEKSMNGISYLTVDGTRLHLSPNNARNKFDYKIKQQGDNIVSKQMIAGSTCKESDIILELNNSKRLSVGDIIQFDNLGAYVLNEISDFLLRKPEVYYCDL